MCADPAHDAVGSMTVIPAPAAMTGTYGRTQDAWSRLVKVVDGGTTLAEYDYDGLHRRIHKAVDPDGDNVKYDYYYNASWQALEVRKDQTAGDDNVYKQYLWSARYIDAVVVRWRDHDTDGNLTDTEDDTLQSCNDANMNVTAVVEEVGGATGTWWSGTCTRGRTARPRC